VQNNEQIITIKGTKDGLIFSIHDDCSFAIVIDELTKVLASIPEEDKTEQRASVIIQVGYRYLTEEQKEQLREMIEVENNFQIEKIDAEVISTKQAEKWVNENALKRISQIVRSGQVVDIEGDVLLIGDVNPGGTLQATGDIYILGKLYGIAHAGSKGNEDAVIAASYMNPTQLKIASQLSRAPDHESDGVYMECAYLNDKDKKIVIDRIQVLPYVRNKLRTLKGGIFNG